MLFLLGFVSGSLATFALLVLIGWRGARRQRKATTLSPYEQGKAAGEEMRKQLLAMQEFQRGMNAASDHEAEAVRRLNEKKE